MKSDKTRTTLIWVVLVLGGVVSLLSYLENQLPWLSAFCNTFGSGCRQAADFTLFGIPIALWGLAFYVAAAAVYRLARPWTFWLVMVGAGVETTLIWLLMTRNIACFFCILNAFVMTVLLILFIRRHQIWQSIAVVLIAYLISSALLIQQNPPPSPPGTQISGASVVAEVEGQPITLRDLESGIAGMLYKKREEIYRLKLGQLEKLIKHRLQDQEKTGAASSNADPKSHNDTITQRARQIMVEILSQRSNIDSYLEKPPLPYTRINAGDSPGIGPPDAPVTVIEFSDYLCPACKWAHSISKEIRKIYGDKIRWVFMDYPLNSHPGADKLAEAARCAGEQDRFWEFQDLLFAAKEHPDAAMLNQFALSLEINVQSFEECLQSAKYSRAVMEDKQEAYRAGVTATPSFIINGRLNPGSMSLENFKQRIDEVLAQSQP